MKFSIKDFFRKCDQIRRKLWIWSHLLKKSLIENFIFCAVIAHKQSLVRLEYAGKKNPETSQKDPEAFLSTFFSIPNLMFCQ